VFSLLSSSKNVDGFRGVRPSSGAASFSSSSALQNIPSVLLRCCARGRAHSANHIRRALAYCGNGGAAGADVALAGVSGGMAASIGVVVVVVLFSGRRSFWPTRI
jgi:hypothetical protein